MSQLTREPTEGLPTIDDGKDEGNPASFIA